MRLREKGDKEVDIVIGWIFPARGFMLLLTAVRDRQADRQTERGAQRHTNTQRRERQYERGKRGGGGGAEEIFLSLLSIGCYKYTLLGDIEGKRIQGLKIPNVIMKVRSQYPVNNK